MWFIEMLKDFWFTYQLTRACEQLLKLEEKYDKMKSKELRP